MTDKEIITETEDWIIRLKILLTSTENKEHVLKHIKLLERLVEMAGVNNG